MKSSRIKRLLCKLEPIPFSLSELIRPRVSLERIGDVILLTSTSHLASVLPMAKPSMSRHSPETLILGDGHETSSTVFEAWAVLRSPCFQHCIVIPKNQHARYTLSALCLREIFIISEISPRQEGRLPSLMVRLLELYSGNHFT